MKTVDDIVAAVAELSPSQFTRLRKKLDQIEKQIWAAELEVTTRKLEKAKVSDQNIDRMVIRRRHEGRR